ncbi:MAG TPA: GntR family transcriptional regulator [Opitutaceae bacterium]|nr:GntR family transcriptional regulator [Opitutaceae bacterium]HPK49793.1 GntR family transcriptional regulator [Opitutaceae bacterium]
MPPLLSIDLHNGVPAYRQIMDQIKLQIATGLLPAGAELPSTRTLSAELALNPMTVSKAYGLLERDGILERRRGQTLTVRAVSDSEAQTSRTEPLRQHLATAAALARQLDIPPTEALRIFKAALHEKPSA